METYLSTENKLASFSYAEAVSKHRWKDQDDKNPELYKRIHRIHQQQKDMNRQCRLDASKLFQEDSQSNGSNMFLD